MIADIFITMAVTDKALGARGGITAFIVERDMPGFSAGLVEKKMGNRGSKTAELIYENVRVPKTNIIGPFGAGLLVALSVLDEGRIILGAGGLGVAKFALEHATKFAKSRIQFGKPISENQGIQWILADMAMEIRLAEYMVYHTALECERLNKMRIRGEKVSRDERERVSRDGAIVKAFCSEMANRALDKCLTIYGATGYVSPNPIERAYRDARVMTIYEGTNEIQRLIIATDILNRNGVL
jgi:acyl-CoA dehydrogenase